MLYSLLIDLKVSLQKKNKSTCFEGTTTKIPSSVNDFLNSFPHSSKERREKLNWAESDLSDVFIYQSTNFLHFFSVFKGLLTLGHLKRKKERKKVH